MPTRPARPARYAALALATAVTACATACAHSAPFVWVDKVPEVQIKGSDGSYVIAVGDVVSVRVWNQDAMTTRAKVRADGHISMLFLNDVAAAGYTPPVLAAELQTRLKDFFNNPVVTVALEDQRPLAVSVLGLVAKQGPLQLDPGSGVREALAAAGGLSEWADKSMIFVLRKTGGTDQRIRMTFESLIHARGHAARFKLLTGDVVVVE
jgi:polysaccharide export outer membrane protein